jgi:hypothetical protein
MRQLTTHKLNGLNDAIKVFVLDEPGSGGACHRYEMTMTNENAEISGPVINFQEGPIAESGVNGISNEALLAVVIDRMQGFQGGDYKCRENAIALTHLEDAMHWLQHRTRARLARGVEGTSKI